VLVTPFVTSRHMLPNTTKVCPFCTQVCAALLAVQGWTTTVAPLVLLDAVRQVEALAPGRMVTPVGTAVALEEVVVVVFEVLVELVLEKTGVPVSQVMEPLQASPGSGVLSHVQDEVCCCATPMAW